MTSEVKAKFKMSRRKRFGFTLIFMIIFCGLYQAGTYVEVDPEEAQALMDEFSKIAESIDGIGIFVHNLSLSLLMFIPGVGFVWGGLAAFQTGMAFSAFVTIEPALANFPALAILLLSPFGIMELFAYGIAMSRSFIILKKLIKRDSTLKKDYIRIGIEVGIVVGLLLVGGLLEAYMIDWAADSGYSLEDLPF